MTVLATAGHVDHGKSTLVEALTGVHPDRWADERRRGMTIDLGFAAATLPSGTEVSFVDVPGHVRYLRNMLAGVGAVRGALLAVSGIEGWRAQSEEHLAILGVLGIEAAVVAITMADLADADQMAAAHHAVAERFDRSTIRLVDVVDTGAPAGLGVDRLAAALDRLVDGLAPAGDRERPRLWVDRAFSVAGAGTVVTGTLADGWLRTGDLVAIEPEGPHSRIRGLHHHGRALDALGPGTRVAVNLHRVALDQVARGHVVAHRGDWHLTRRVDASLTVLDTLDHPVGRRGAFALHVGTAEVPTQLRVLHGERIDVGATGTVRFHLARSLPLVAGDRYVLRDAGRSATLGGGEILDVAPRLPMSRARPDRSVARVVAEWGTIDVDELARLTGVRVEPTVGRWAMAPAARAAQEAGLRHMVAEAGDMGVPLVALDEPIQALAGVLAGHEVRHGRLRAAERVDDRDRSVSGSGSDPIVVRLEADGFRPAQPERADERQRLHELAAAGVVVSCDGTWFAAGAVERATAEISRMLATNPGGVTVSTFREQLGTTRRYALALLAHFDATGRTRRRGDVRIAGPRLDPPPAGTARPGVS